MIRHSWLPRFLIVCLVVFCAVGPFLPRQLLFDLLNPISVAIWVGALLAYRAGLRDALRGRAELTGGHLLVVALNGVGIYVVFRHSLNWIWRELGEPSWIQNSFAIALLIFVVSLAGVLALGAEEVIGGRVPPPLWRRIGIIVAAALSVGWAVFALARYLD